MGEFDNKVEGSIKEGAGKLTGNEELEARGAGQKAVGEVQEGARKVEGKVEEVAGRATGNVGEQVKGEVKQA